MINSLNALAENFFAKFASRFRRKEKDAFLEYCITELSELGYSEEEIFIQKSGFGKNLIIGPQDADILITAHYDTPANNGFLLFANPLVGQALGNLVLIFVMAALSFLSGLVVSLSGSLLTILPLIVNIVILVLLVLCFIIKNKNNHNDNTSGVLGVFSTASLVAKNPELRKKCAFVLFDNEELGLLGSSAFAKWRNKNFPGKKKQRRNKLRLYRKRRYSPARRPKKTRRPGFNGDCGGIHKDVPGE